MSTDPTSSTGAAPGPARFSLAANYDPELFRRSPYPVDEVYGKLPTDGVGGGRPRYWRHRFGSRSAAILSLLDRHGIAFNYLLNGACFGNANGHGLAEQATALLVKLANWACAGSRYPRLFC